MSCSQMLPGRLAVAAKHQLEAPWDVPVLQVTELQSALRIIPDERRPTYVSKMTNLEAKLIRTLCDLLLLE